MEKREFIIIKGSHHKIKIPNLRDRKFALFLGLFYGDGWLARRDYAVKKGRWRIGFVEGDLALTKAYKKLIKELFNITAHAYKRKHAHATEVNFDSHIVHNFLCEVIGYEGGRKYNFLKFPPFLDSNDLKIEFLKGLYTTDGKVTHSKNYVRIVFDSISEKLVDDIIKTEKDFNLNPRKAIEIRNGRNHLHSVFLNGYKEAEKFSSMIGFLGKKQKILNDVLPGKSS